MYFAASSRRRHRDSINFYWRPPPIAESSVNYKSLVNTQRAQPELNPVPTLAATRVKISINVLTPISKSKVRKPKPSTPPDRIAYNAAWHDDNASVAYVLWPSFGLRRPLTRSIPASAQWLTQHKKFGLVVGIMRKHTSLVKVNWRPKRVTRRVSKRVGAASSRESLLTACCSTVLYMRSSHSTARHRSPLPQTLLGDCSRGSLSQCPTIASWTQNQKTRIRQTSTGFSRLALARARVSSRASRGPDDDFDEGRLVESVRAA